MKFIKLKKFTLKKLIFFGLLSILLNLSGTSYAAPITVSVNGVIQSIAGVSVEPLVGVGDSYSTSFSFDVDTDQTVGNVSGTALINGNSTNVTAFLGIFAASTGAARLRFSITPFGQGPGIGNVNVHTLEMVFTAPSVLTSSIFDILTASDVTISPFFNVIGSFEVAAGLNPSNNIDRNPTSVIASSVPGIIRFCDAQCQAP